MLALFLRVPPVQPKIDAQGRPIHTSLAIEELRLHVADVFILMAISGDADANVLAGTFWTAGPTDEAVDRPVVTGFESDSAAAQHEAKPETRNT